MEKRYPYKTPWPMLIGTILFVGLFVAGVLLLASDPEYGQISPRVALLVGLSVSGLAMLLTATMRWLRPPYLTIRDDGIYLPGRPKEGWRIGFAEITNLRLHPPVMGSRRLDLEAQSLPLSNEDRWWSISERPLPNQETFDEIYSHILSRVGTPSPVSGDGMSCGFLQFSAAGQLLDTAVNVEGTARFPNQIVANAISDPAARVVFNPSGNLFSIGQIKPGDRIEIQTGGQQHVIVAPDDDRQGLVLDVLPYGEVHMRSIEEESRHHTQVAST